MSLSAFALGMAKRIYGPIDTYSIDHIELNTDDNGELHADVRIAVRVKPEVQYVDISVRQIIGER